MGRTRDVSKILTSNTSILTLSSASATYLTQSSASTTYATSANFPATGWTTYSPVVRGSNGSQLGSYSTTVKYVRFGKTVHLVGSIAITTISPANNSQTIFSLPSGLPVAGNVSGVGRENAQTGTILQVNPENSTEVAIRTSSNQGTNVNGYALIFSLTYETS
jgi:hypothetical protein